MNAQVRLLPLMIFMACVGGFQVKSAYCDNKTLQTVTINTRDELVRAIEAAGPGTRILIAPGTYRGGLRFAGLHGAKGEPIVLAALDENKPPAFKGGSSCMHLTNPRYIELHHLHISGASGNGLNIDDGGNVDSPANQILLSHLQVKDIGPNGNRDGIKLSGVQNFVINDCTFQRWGSGGSAIDMVGCHHGQVNGCRFQYRDDIPGNGVQTKGGSSDITIKRCRFENAGGRAVNVGGSTGRDYFRPRSPGYEAKDITVEDCEFIGSSAPIAFVGADGATVRYNTIYRPTRWVVRILQESRGADFIPCRKGSFSNNVIVFRSDELRSVVNVGSGTAPETFRFANNHWFCIDNPLRGRQLGLPVEEQNGSYGRDPDFVNADTNDLRLRSTTPVRDAGVRAIRNSEVR